MNDVKWTHAKKGKKFVITDAGRQVYHVNTKFAEWHTQRKKYESCVPKSWIRNGYVEEIEVGEK